MTYLTPVVALICAGALCASAVRADSPQDRIQLIDLSELQLNENPNFEGVSATFLTGAFDQEGLYAAHARMVEGTVFPPHVHPDMRLTLVTSGTMYLGQGQTLDTSQLVAYPAGTVALTPPGVFHYMVAQDGDVTMLEIGAGPSGSEFATN